MRVLAALMLLACTRADEPATVENAQRAVERFFAAADAGDCATLKRMRMKPATDEECRDFVRHWRDNQTRYLGIAESTLDGRKPGTFLLTASLEMGGKEQKLHRWVVPVEKQQGGWKVGIW